MRPTELPKNWIAPRGENNRRARGHWEWELLCLRRLFLRPRRLHLHRQSFLLRGGHRLALRSGSGRSRHGGFRRLARLDQCPPLLRCCNNSPATSDAQSALASHRGKWWRSLRRSSSALHWLSQCLDSAVKLVALGNQKGQDMFCGHL